MQTRVTLVYFTADKCISKRFTTSAAAIDYAKNVLKITDFEVRGIMVFREDDYSLLQT